MSGLIEYCQIKGHIYPMNFVNDLLRISMVPMIFELFLFFLGTYICFPETLWFMFIRSEFKSWVLEFLVTLKYFPQYLFKQNQS